jgi:uncharacterized protein YcbK (DUF882 family)
MHGMTGKRPSFAAFSVSALTLVSTLAFVPATASASTHAAEADEAPRTAHADPAHSDPRACSKPAVEVAAGPESATFPLERCDGEPIPASIDKLSVLARAEGVARPKEITSKPHEADVAPGIRRLDGRLLERLELVADHFRKEAEPVKIVVVSSKSRSAGSYHASGRALDFRIDGVEDDEVAAFCKTLKDTGCGFYPNGGFVHMDARDAGGGHVAWIDVSRRGDTPKYVAAWPIPSEKTEKAEPEKSDKAESKSEKLEAKAESKPEPKAEKCEAKPEEKSEKLEAKAEKSEKAEGALPSLPAAVQAVPMESPKAVEVEATPAPAKKHHHRHRHTSHTDHTV